MDCHKDLWECTKAAVAYFDLATINPTAIMYPSASWTLYKNDEEPDLLRHEQGQFDIAEIFATRLATWMKGAKAGAVSYSAQHARAMAHNLLVARFNEQYQSLFTQLQQAQATYDAQTVHGADNAAQNRYNDSLKNGQIPAAGTGARKP